MLPLYLIAYSSAFSVGDPIDEENTQNVNSATKKKTFE